MTTLRAASVGMVFGGVRALDGVDLEASSGRVLGLIGPNGAGKSTLVNVLTGFYTPTSGRVVLDDVELAGMRPTELAHRGVARTFQNLRLFERQTCLENVLIGRHRFFAAQGLQAALSRKTKARERDLCRGLLDRLDIGPYADLDVTSQPYGIRRRVEIARALAVEPSLLLLDEPVAGMTRDEAYDIAELIKKLRGEGLGVVLIEHNVKLVADVSDHVVVLNWGKVVAAGDPGTVWANPVVRAAYFGDTENGDADVDAV